MWYRVQQEPDDVAVPVVDVVPTDDVVPVIVEDVPVMHGVAMKGVIVIGAGETVIVVVTGAAGLIVRGVGGGLSPPDPSSVEPSGTPRRPTAMEAMPVGDDADAAGCASDMLPATEQVPETVPLTPPPSKVDVEIDVPALDIPDPVEVADIALPMEVPVVELLMLVVSPVLEVPSPKDACGIEPPMPEHALALPVVSASGEAPTTSGLVPGVAIAVAPRGMPVGATGAPGPMPSGDVMPTAGVGLPPICAKTGWLPTSVAAIAIINGRFIITGFL
jgi:hypothetical protein